MSLNLGFLLIEEIEINGYLPILVWYNKLKKLKLKFKNIKK